MLMKKVIFAFMLIVLILPCSALGASLSGMVFHDYNGNGLLDPGEPGITGAEVTVGSQSFISDENGLYWIGGLSNRTYEVSVKSPTDDPATAFRYISVFKGWVDIPAYEMNGVLVPDQHLADAPVQGIDDPANIKVDGETNVDIGLMNGFVTLPFRAEDVKSALNPSGYWLSTYADLNVEVGAVRNFKGNTHFCPAKRSKGLIGCYHKAKHYSLQAVSGVPEECIV